jgi:hypothetical protein
MEDILFTHIGAINADKSLFKVKEMQKQVQLGLQTFCSAPNTLSAPHLLTITEVPSETQARKLAQIACDALNIEYHCDYKQVQKADYTVLLWDANRFTLSANQPKTHSTRFLGASLDCKLTQRTHLCAAVHRERGQNPRTFDAIHRSFDDFEHDHVHIFGDMNAKSSLLEQNFESNEYIVGLSEGEVTTQAGRQCDNVIWDSDMSVDSADVLCESFCRLSHYPVQSFAYMDDLF